MKINLPDHWSNFIKIFTKKHNETIIYDVVRVFRNEEEIQERYDTYEFEDFLPEYIPITDDSGGQVAVISKNNKDTKVYLTSYGVLQEEYLEVLDRDLLHWMQRKFPFESKKNELSETDIEKHKNENTLLLERISSFTDITEFLKKAIAIEGIALPEYYAPIEHIYYFQDGYHYNSVENKNLTSDKPGDFKSNWIVLATNYFDDPFFIDLNEAEQMFPVYFAYHGQGDWEPIKIADSLKIFQEILEDVQNMRYDKTALINYFDENIDVENLFWKDVYLTIEDESVLDWEEIKQESFDSIGSKVNLYITDVGPNKMKVIALLKKELDISGSEALELSKSPRILFTTGYSKWLQNTYTQLEGLGAVVEFEILD
ncbi:hypothetical protein [Chryseobacterium artocarpi]|uniref:hypothetical protein n=1 Tax=Chryseobacterium artocarpi TaxID=1414727 RepID=UPI003F34F0CE